MNQNRTGVEALKIHQLTKLYKLPRSKGAMRTAVDHLGLAVGSGEIFGFLGPNGAGKTTTIKMLLSFVRPTSGDAWIFGEPVEFEQARKSVGYVPEQPYFPKFLTSIELVRGHGAMHGLSLKAAAKRADECLEQVGMSYVRHIPLAQLSKGMTQRIGLACALVADPCLLILDEPSSGLDPVGRRELRELLMQFRQQGKTIFLSSHLLSEMESVCDRVGVLADGKLVACGRPQDLVEVRDRIAVEFAAEAADTEIEGQLADVGSTLRETPEPEKRGLVTALTSAAGLYDVIALLRRRRATLFSVTPERETLEDAFLRLVKGAVR